MVNFLQIGSMSGRSTLISSNRFGPNSMGLVCIAVSPASRASLEAVTKIVPSISAARPDLPR
jgi:hypothetical protein